MLQEMRYCDEICIPYKADTETLDYLCSKCSELHDILNVLLTR